MSRHLEATQPVTDYPSIAYFSSTKPSLFHGYENVNVERWIKKFKLHLTRAHEAAASELALHLAGPAEAFYHGLRESQRSNFEDLCIQPLENVTPLEIILGDSGKHFLADNKALTSL